MKVFATFFCNDGFRREEILDDLYKIYRLPRAIGNRLWMAKPENSIALTREHRTFHLESRRVIKNEYGTTVRAIYREEL